MKIDEVRRLALEAEGDGMKILRSEAKRMAAEAGFGLVDQTRITTAVSEIGRNAIIHGRGGRARIESLIEGEARGLRFVFEDDGPGIPDVELAMTDGYSTGSGLGLGLGGAARLIGDLTIDSPESGGTVVTMTKWVRR